MAISSTRRIALAMVGATVAMWAVVLPWFATRKLVPLDIPAALSRGHIRTGAFSLNIDSGYDIFVSVEETPSLPHLDCLVNGCDEQPSIFKAQWSVSKNG